MRRSSTMNFPLLSLLFISFLLTGNPTASCTKLTKNATIQDVCAKVNCWQGTCKPLLIGFDCECYTGWNKIQIGPLIFPACVIPNCTINFTCGNGSPPPPPPSVSPPPPPPNILDPCFMVWCFDGTCMPNGTKHYCQCNDGSGNLFNNPEFACFKQCNLGGDCPNIPLGRPSPPPPPATSGTDEKGSKNVPNSSRSIQASTMILLVTTLLTLL